MNSPAMAVLGRALLVVVLFMGPGAGRASFAAEPGITQSQAKDILTELKQIRALLEKSVQQGAPRPANPAPPPPQKVRVPESKAAYEAGRPDAPLTLVEFSDYECPYCRQFDISTYQQLKQDYIDTGKLRFVNWDLPLDSHKSAFGAANAARCAGEQGRYWDLRHVMMVNDNALGRESLLTYARDLGLDLPRFEACVTGESHGAEIRRQSADAKAIGVSATPSFVLGRTSGQGTEGLLIVGAMPYADFKARIDTLLASPR